MRDSVIFQCLVILCLLHLVLCDVVVDRDSKSYERTKRNHENESPKRTLVQNKLMKTTTPICSKNIELKVRTVPNSVNKAKLPINERDEPKDVRTINHILGEIANLANNHNETKGIHKIRHLVDEIDNLDKMKSHVKSVETPKKKLNSNDKEKKVKENKSPQELKTQKDPVKKITNPVFIENKGLLNKNKTLTNGWCYKEIPTHVTDETTSKAKNENLIEIKEHKYEEEILSNPYKYKSYWKSPNYNYEPYVYNGNGNTENSANYNYPIATYEHIGNNGYYYGNSPNQLTSQDNGDYTRYRKTWQDRNTIITGSPNELATINEDRKELPNIQTPDYYRKYYCDEQYSRNNEVQNNQYDYYVNPVYKGM